jgi:DNA-binding LacI/PurR family transcriptional regulator
MTTRARTTTLKDVASLTGLSVGIVSMALADDPRVAAATRVAVLRAAQELDYVPNSAARALRVQRLGAIAVVVPHSSQHVFSHPYFSEVLQGISEVLEQHDFTLVLSTSRREQDEDNAYTKILRGRRADGVIVVSAAIGDRNIQRLALSGYPVVFLGRGVDLRITAVGVDDLGGAEQAVGHLVGLHQRRRIAHITGPLAHQSAVDKLTGYRAALETHGLAFDEALVVEGDYSQESGARACAQLLDQRVAFNALFAANDEMASGALQILRRKGVHVPRDVAIVGYDNVQLAGLLQPPLTTVHQPMAELGHLAAERLLALLAKDPPEPSRVELPTRLVIRESCGCSEADTTT